ncbi:MAG TPA: head GIN domain-containing protein [Casimicrobiaceae bacterium]|nr:head GIN domain-containing protein [Casimicrobiaceae bacterium]
MKAFLIAFAAIVAATLIAIAAVSYGRAAQGSRPVHEARALAGFHAIDVAGHATLTLVQGATEGVSIDAPASTRVRTDVQDGKLEIEIDDRRHAWQWLPGPASGRAAHITVNLRELSRIETAGAVSIDADALKGDALSVDLSGACTMQVGDLQVTTLKLDGSGATKVDLAGKVVRQSVDLSGAGVYEAGKLASEQAVVEVSGAGKATVNARDSLAVDISGAGKVDYYGDPKLKQTISGIGKVTRREAP